MRITFSWPPKDQRLEAKIRSIQSRAANQKIARAVGLSGIRAQDHARLNLQAMVYSQPKAASGYIRTNSLMRGMAAHKSSRPNTGQGAAAQAGVDLKATDPMAVVEQRGKNIYRTSVSNPVRYAEFVHDGIRQPSERPFMDGVDEAYDDAIITNINDAVIQIDKLKK